MDRLQVVDITTTLQIKTKPCTYSRSERTVPARSLYSEGWCSLRYQPPGCLLFACWYMTTIKPPTQTLGLVSGSYVLLGMNCQCPCNISSRHYDIITWKSFPHYWPFVRGIHWSPKGHWCGSWCFLSADMGYHGTVYFFQFPCFHNLHIFSFDKTLG